MSHRPSFRTLDTLLVLVAIFVVTVVAGTLQQAAHRGIPTGSAPPPASPSGSSLYVDDVDGPPVEVLIGGTLVASVLCGSGDQLVPGQADVPPLPWSLDVRRTGGAALGHWDVTRAGYLMLLIRADTIALGTFAGDGPAPAPGACARWSSSPGATEAATASPPPSSSATAPTIVCDPDTGQYAREVGPDGSLVPVVITLTCDRAVTAARAVVAHDSDIDWIEFAFGPWCPPGAFCSLILPNTGHVVFHMKHARPDIVVDVRSDAAGTVTISEPFTIPSPSPS